MQIINANKLSEQNNLKQEWEDLLEQNAKEENLDDLFRSYDWIDHLSSYKKNENVYVAIERLEEGKLSGLVPFTQRDYALKFDLKSHVIRNKSLCVNWMLGNDLLLPNGENSFDEFFNKVLNEFEDTDGIYFESVKKNSFLWNYLSSSKSIKKHFFLYLPEGMRDYFYLNLPDTYDAYWDSHKSCHKKDTMRKIRKINNHFNSMSLRCYNSEESIPEFLDIATNIAKKSWQYEVIGQRISNDTTTVKNKQDLARRNIFRSYILFGGDEPLAFSCGFRHKDTWIGDEIGFDKSLSKFSPGWILICSIIEDLIKEKYKKVNLGVGEGEHKARVCNSKNRDTSLLLLKRNIKNYILIKDHSGYRITKKYLKKITDRSKNTK